MTSTEVIDSLSLLEEAFLSFSDRKLLNDRKGILISHIVETNNTHVFMQVVITNIVSAYFSLWELFFQGNQY